jgi:hypothetical protein
VLNNTSKSVGSTLGGSSLTGSGSGSGSGCGSGCGSGSTTGGAGCSVTSCTSESDFLYSIASTVVFSPFPYKVKDLSIIACQIFLKC